MFFEDFLAYLTHWFSGRQWKKVCLLASPLIIVVLATASFLLVCLTQDRQQLLAGYLEAAEEELNGKAITGEALADVNQSLEISGSDNSREAGLRLRRVLALEGDNTRATFLIALRLWNEGRAGAVRYLLRRIAPTGESGYQPAHAWLASEALSRLNQLDEDDQDALYHDLAEASDWPEVNSQLLIAYAGLMKERDGTDSALRFLRSRVAKYPDLNLAIAELARNADKPREYERAVSDSRRMLVERVTDGSAEPLDFARLSALYLMSQDPESAIRIAGAGLGRVQELNEQAETVGEDVEQQLRRVMSTALRMQFHLTAKDSGDGKRSVNLELLDKAMQIDPSNAEVLSDVSQLIATGSQASEAMVMTLKRSIADGTATKLTRLILANYYLSKGDTNKALPHLRTAYERDQDNLIILNNYAFALLEGSAEDIALGIQLVDRALERNPSNPSVLDTKGQLLEKQGNIHAAINCYEDAVRAKPDKLNTRQRLANAYAKAGMQELAETQRQRLEELRAAADSEK